MFVKVLVKYYYKRLYKRYRAQWAQIFEKGEGKKKYFFQKTQKREEKRRFYVRFHLLHLQTMSTAQYRVDNAMGLYFPFIWRGTQEEEGGDVPIGYYGVVRG